MRGSARLTKGRARVRQGSVREPAEPGVEVISEHGVCAGSCHSEGDEEIRPHH